MESFIQRQTEIRNGITLYVSQALSRCQPHGVQGRIAQEANAFGKAERYADVGTVD